MKKHLFRIAILSTVFALGIGTVIYNNTSHKEVDAAQYNANYAPYTYTGNYYSAIDFDAAGGIDGALRESLTTLIRPEAFYTYSGTGANTLATQLQSADEDPTNSNNMVYLYTRDSVAKNPASSWNREHVWCKSLSNGNWQKAGGNGEQKAGTDILHLRPTYQSPNSTRGNCPYGNTDHTTVKKYNGMTYGYMQNGYFEPLDCVKGDVARIIMYVYTTYINYPNYSPIYITDIFENYDTLLQWHTMDKPDVLEGNRNDYAQISKQKNRNPFVDHPELGWKIFGNEASASVKNACMQAYPANGGGDPIDPTGITLNRNTASLKTGKTLQLNATLQPAGATGTVTWSSNSSSVASVNNSGLITANTAGEATITASVAGYSASCVVTVTESIINYGTEQNPLTVSEAIDLIDEFGSSTTTEPIYVKGIVSSNTAFTGQSSYATETWLKSEDGQTAQAFELYKAKIDTSKVTGDYSAANSLEDKEIVAYGYAKKYYSTYELCTANTEPKNPLIIHVSAPEVTDIYLNQETANIEVGGTVTLTATLVPENAEATYTWESSDESVATVGSGVVTGVSAGTAIITAKVSDSIAAECTVTVTDGGNVTGLVQMANSIAAGDTVYLTANAVSKQYNGPSNGDSGAYGTGIAFTDSPDTEGLALEVCGGNETNSYAFKLKSGTYSNRYLAWSSGNSLKVDTTINNNSSWLVSFDANKNATISNVADNARVIWWNVGSPRFSCYTGKTDGNSYKYTQLWKAVSQIEITPNDYLDSAQTIKTLSGRETVTGNGTINGSIVFGSLGLENGKQYLDPFVGNGFTVAFAGGANDGKYYDGGTGIRTYGNGTITIASTGTISQIALTWDGSNKPNSNNVVDVGTYNYSTGVWTGSANSVVFTRPSGSGHWRLKTVSVTSTGETITVDQVALRVGGIIPIDDWTTINDSWPITEYGIVFARQSMLTARGLSSAEAVFRNDSDDVGRVYNDSGNHPKANGDKYVFTARLNLEEEDYDEVFYMAPYILADGEYYFFEEIHYSVRTLAQECLTTHDTSLSNAALNKLK